MERELYKIVICGKTGAGKSELCLRMDRNRAEPACVLGIGVEFCVVERKIGERLIKLQIWDNPVTERIAPPPQSHYRGAAVALLVQDLAQEDFQSVFHYAQSARDVSPGVRLLLVGNKADLAKERKASLEQMLGAALKLGATYVEVSAKTGQAIEDLVQEVIRVARLE